MALLHKHDWASTSHSYHCLNCSAEVATIIPYTTSWTLYDDNLYDDGTYDKRTNAHSNLPPTVSDLTHLVDSVWYQMGGIGIPL